MVLPLLLLVLLLLFTGSESSAPVAHAANVVPPASNVTDTDSTTDTSVYPAASSRKVSPSSSRRSSSSFADTVRDETGLFLSRANHLHSKLNYLGVLEMYERLNLHNNKDNISNSWTCTNDITLYG